jgi:hypothetical protein
LSIFQLRWKNASRVLDWDRFQRTSLQLMPRIHHPSRSDNGFGKSSPPAQYLKFTIGKCGPHLNTFIPIYLRANSACWIMRSCAGCSLAMRTIDDERDFKSSLEAFCVRPDACSCFPRFSSHPRAAHRRLRFARGIFRLFTIVVESWSLVINSLEVGPREYTHTHTHTSSGFAERLSERASTWQRGEWV